MNEVTPEEDFEYAFKNFIDFVKILAMDAPDLQCQAQGNYNTAGEMRFFVMAGAYLFRGQHCLLTQIQKEGIMALVAKMESLPRLVLDHPNTSKGNLAAMSDPWWIPVNAQAKELLALLEPATKKNQEYFASLGPPTPR